MNTDSLVVIRTYGNLLDADVAQIELLNAGIYSLLLSDENAQVEPGTGGSEGISLAVNGRDSDVAIAVLTPLPQAV